MDDRTPWRSLAERAGEGACQTSELPWRELDEHLVNRRDFLKVAGGALSLAALAACSGPPPQEIVPYVKAPPEYTPGEPLYYATALPRYGYGRGVLVECHEGRPTKIEGNPLHPASLGATDATTQAAIRGLWDPYRSRTPLQQGHPAAWNSFVTALTARRLLHEADRGAGLCMVLDPIASPTEEALLAAVRRRFPKARLFTHDPLHRGNALAGARLAFGETVEVYPRLSEADIVLALDCDFLGDHRDALRLASEFARRREPALNSGAMNRLYAVECAPSITGAMADHRFAVRSCEVHAVAAAVAAALGLISSTMAAPIPAAELRRLAGDLRAHSGRALILAGERQPPAVHALVHALNTHLRNNGTTLDYLAPVRAPGDDLQPLIVAMAEDRVQTLLILGANPAYTAPADLEFERHLRDVPFSVHLGLYEDETARACRWHIPQTHVFETWGDLRGPDGSATICQPMIAPLFGGRSALELLATLAGKSNVNPYDLVRDHWQPERASARSPVRPPASRVEDDPPNPLDERWHAFLQTGVVPGTAATPRSPRLRQGAVTPPAEPLPDLEINFLPDPTVGDGRDAANPWMQELPKPVTQLTWDNALLVAPRTAARLKLQHEGYAEVQHGGATLRAPVWITPGHAEGAVTLHLGYGRRAGGAIAMGHGVDAYRLRRNAAPEFAGGIAVRPGQGHHRFACAQSHHTVEGRDLLRHATLDAYRANPRFAQHDAAQERGDGLFEPFAYIGYAWGMSIDLNACTGCSACVIACQAENNIPSVGKAEVRKGREMHWLRIDRYYVGPPEAPRTLFQPVLCMHCENAPCEPVCPVEASIHDDEGLNVQVYNRCIGTRFCSNNCPYKVRRFNFLQYTQDEPVTNQQHNPDATVRMRGVMEKCTFCLQRIAKGRIAAEREGRRLRDGEVITACQAVCPTSAIVFGDLNDPSSAVNARKRSPRDYPLLSELRTKPRTTYLAKLENPATEPSGTETNS